MGGKRKKKVRRRIREFRPMLGRDLVANERNWRLHDDEQRAVLRGIVDEIGAADVLLGIEVGDEVILVDGHLRAQEYPDVLWDVAILDMDESEAQKYLLVHDAVGGLAKADRVALDELAQAAEFSSDAVNLFLDDLVNPKKKAPAAPKEVSVDEGFSYQIMIYCDDEVEQSTLLQRLENEGVKCKPLIL